jgi:branched-chain amino acid transport system permease protein
MAIGGYTTAALVVHEHWRDVWTIPLAGLAAGLVGFVVGLPALRLSGLYLALATFALAVAMPSLLKKDVCVHHHCLTGGTSGINLFERRLGELTGAATLHVHVLGHTFSQNDFFYYLAWGIGLVLTAVAWLVLRGRAGRAFRALRDSEIAAASSGVHLATYKTLAFAISGFYAGVAGSLFLLVSLNGFAVPQAFGFDLSLLLLVGLVVGGLGSLWALALGALFIEYMPIWAQDVSKAPGLPSVFFGAAIVLVMILLPGGAGGLARRIAEPLTRRL